MDKAPELRHVLRWAFLGIGAFLIIRPDFALNSALSLHPLMQLLFPDSRRNQDLALIPVFVLIMQAGILSLITAWGLHRLRPWSRWTGLAACLCLLADFPWFTIVGIIGLPFVLKVSLAPGSTPHGGLPQNTSTTSDFWSRAKTSRAQAVVAFLSGTFIILGLDGSYWMARRIGLPESTMGWEWWLYLFAFALANTAVHELGHAFAAWTFRHRIRVISVGPLVFLKTRHGHSLNIQWTRLWETSGYMASIPTIPRYERLQQIIVVAAGPFASLLSGSLAFAVFLSMPGTEWQSYWPFVSMAAVVGFTYVLTSAAPFGYTDGSMLMHLLRWTPAGQILVESNIAAYQHEEARDCYEAADFNRQIAICEELMKGAAKRGAQNERAIAVCNAELGLARLALGDWVGAELALRESVRFEAECSANPALGANAWALLHNACVRRHNLPEAERVYHIALAALGRQKAERSDGRHSVSHAMLAELHQRAGQYQLAIQEASVGLRRLSPTDKELSLRMSLLCARSASLALTGLRAEGLAGAEAALASVRSRGRTQLANLSWSQIGQLGANLSRAGECQRGIELLEEAISRLEANGAVMAAARHRISVAEILSYTGQYDRAVQTLPTGELPVCLRRARLRQLAQLRLQMSLPDEALFNCRELVSSWGDDANAEGEIGSSYSLYAAACLDTHAYDDAKDAADRGLEILMQWQHPDSLRCAVVSALARWRLTGDWVAASLRDVERLISVDPLLTAWEQAQLLGQEATRLEKHGRLSDGQELRSSPLMEKSVNDARRCANLVV